MKKYIFLFLMLLLVSATIKAQIFTQNFESSTLLSDYVSNTPSATQLSEVHSEPGVDASITNKALRIEKTAFLRTYFYRTPNPALTEPPKFVQFKFDFEVTNNSQDHPDNRREIPFYFGPTFEANGTSISTFHSRFGLGISATPGNFFLKILDNGSTKSTEFSGKQTITLIINNSGKDLNYTAPNESTETIGNDKWEIWVGNTKVFNEVSAKNKDLNLGSFKFQYNSFLPKAILDFDNIEMTALEEKEIEAGEKNIEHPRIWVKDSDKQSILDKINTVTWAKKLFDQYKSRVASLKSSHGANPQTIVNSIPALPGSRTTHRERLTMGFDAALLYWLTGDNDYGQIAADILHQYTTEISKKSGNIDFHKGSGSTYLIDSREAYTKPPMIYDFVFGFLMKPETTVYDKSTQTRVKFNFTKAETAFKKLADNVFSRGGLNNNHPVLEAPGALFNTLAIDDDATREAYFNKFMNGTSRQNGLTWMMEECKESGIWPESTGYTLGPQRIILELMEIVDKYKPSLNVVDDNLDIIESSFLFEDFRFPNGNEVMRFGDGHRTRLNTQALMERVVVITNRKGYTNFKDKSEAILKAIYDNKSNGYNPTVSTQSLEWNNPLQLLYNIDVDATNVMPINYNRSINISHAGITMQRNINTTNVEEYGLMGYTGGAHYVHSHLSGIDMELYGLGVVLGTGGGDVGASARNGEEFRNYHRIFAGHNTVIVNGKSKGGGKGSWKSDNQLFMNKTQTLAIEPKSREDAIANEFSFSAQELDDKINNAKQQRVFSVIRTSNTTGYYFDLFRSKSLGTNDFHDYVYHNVGNGVSLVDENNNPLPLSSRTGRYTSTPSVYNNKTIHFPGWHYFEDVETSNATKLGVKATIGMTRQGTRYMHVIMPSGENREYTACKGPATIEAQMGYKDVKTPILTVRHIGEAWNKPFISIFEPSRKTDGAVKSVENLYQEDKIVGAKVVSDINGTIITDFIISNENNSETFESINLGISFKGRFAIVRTKQEVGKETRDVSMYIGEGQQLTFLDEELIADSEGKAYSEVFNRPLSTKDNLVSTKSIFGYPNPTFGKLEITVPKELTKVKTEIYTLRGQLIASSLQNTNNAKVSLDISDYVKGIYLIKVNLDKPVYLKIIKN
ncbi:T9SS type A sorting domain-containing protein [Polaribacter septentrionalilitoris]|uniref:T9SS type A sorting domain-containing protein n=1 Tax=Polaribacter septentrionalilitoris TaxID=2494657 RepID=UPI0013567CF8|nr:T9SS type A sorting domain-containing protein [Polaribacter septentrionalilitoris]